MWQLCLSSERLRNDLSPVLVELAPSSCLQPLTRLQFYQKNLHIQKMLHLRDTKDAILSYKLKNHPRKNKHCNYA